MQAVLKAQINKTDRNDARGIAQMMRVGLYRPVHVKTLRSQKLRMMLTHRKLLQSKAIAIENDLRGTLRNFGLKVGIAGKTKFEARIKELVENLPDLAELVEPMLVVRRRWIPIVSCSPFTVSWVVWAGPSRRNPSPEVTVTIVHRPARKIKLGAALVAFSSIIRRDRLERQNITLRR